MRERFDIVIAGGGIIGAAIAFQLSRRSRLKVLVLDKGISPGTGSTGASSSVCRHRYSSKTMIRLARNGIEKYQVWSDFLESASPIARYHKQGVLWLSDMDASETRLDHERLTNEGIPNRLLSDADLHDAFPMLSPCLRTPDFQSGEEHACSGGGLHLLEEDGGYVEPMDALQDLIDAGRHNGVEFRFGATITGVELRSGEVQSVDVDGTETIACDAFVNAAGPWCHSLSQELQLPERWKLEPTRIQIVQIDRPDTIPLELPICADLIGGIYFRLQNQGSQLIIGSTRPEDELEQISDPDNLANYADDNYIHDKLWALQHRLPRLDQIRSVRGYAGVYTVNRTDVHPLVGATDIANYFVANGMSGHGFKLAPAIGALVATAITGETLADDPAVETSALGIGRDPIKVRTKSAVA